LCLEQKERRKRIVLSLRGSSISSGRKTRVGEERGVLANEGGGEGAHLEEGGAKTGPLSIY